MIRFEIRLKGEESGDTFEIRPETAAAHVALSAQMEKETGNQPEAIALKALNILLRDPQSDPRKRVPGISVLCRTIDPWNDGKGDVLVIVGEHDFSVERSG